MADYGWTHETLLVVLPTSAFSAKVTRATATATAFLPRNDPEQSRPQQGLDIAVVALSRQWSTTALPYYERTHPLSGAATTTVLHPKLAFYLPTGASTSNLPAYFVSLVASSRGGIEVLAGDESERVSLRGPFRTTNGPFALAIAPPVGTTFYVQNTDHGQWLYANGVEEPLTGLTGTAAAVVGADHPSDFASQTPVSEATAGTCADGLDNDPDGFADGCDFNCVVHADFGGAVHDHTATYEYSRDYALLGDLRFCSCEAPGIAEASMTLFALDASQILNSVQPPAEDYPMPVRAPPFRLMAAACDLRAPGSTPEVSCEAARACQNDGVCPGSLSTYPLSDVNDNYSSMRAAAWGMYDDYVAGQAAANAFPVQLVGIVSDEYGYDPIDQEYIKGLANFVANQPALNGAFVVSAIPNGGITAGANIAHEIGHTLGLQHEDGSSGAEDATVLWPGTTRRGFMTSGDGDAPILNWDAPSRIGNLTQGEVWQGPITSKFHPGASGFEFTGCDDDGDCQTGHPDLICCSEQCEVAPCN